MAPCHACLNPQAGRRSPAGHMSDGITDLQVMKPVLTPVRHSARRKHKSLDSSSGELSVRMPTRHDASVDPSSIRLHQCVIDGIFSLASVQQTHSSLAAAVPCVSALMQLRP